MTGGDSVAVRLGIRLAWLRFAAGRLWLLSLALPGQVPARNRDFTMGPTAILCHPLRECPRFSSTSFRGAPGERTSSQQLQQRGRITQTYGDATLKGFNIAWMQDGRRESDQAEDGVDEQVYNLGQEITPPRATRTKRPEYTDRARRAAIRGTVLLGFIVTSKGLPKQIVVVDSLDTELDRAAVEALKEWRFSPATKDGKPVAVRLTVEFTFKVL